MKNGKYIKVNLDSEVLKDMEYLTRIEIGIGEVIINGFTKDCVEVEYTTELKKAIALGLIEKNEN